MSERKLLAKALYDFAKNSETEFVEISADSELAKVASKFNISVPNPDIAILKTYYLKVGEANGNGVLLSKSEVEKGLSTIIGKHCNWSHNPLGKGVCGYVLDAKMEKDMMIIYTAIFKSLFTEEFSKVKEKFAKKQLSVSFEIWSKNPLTGKSVVQDLGNGKITVSPIIFHGCGILIGDNEKPACPQALAQKLLATFKIDETMEKIRDMFKSRQEDFVFASLNSEEECSQCKVCNCKKEDKIVETFLFELAEQQVLELSEDEINSFENEYESDFEEAKKLTYEQKKNLPDEDYAVVITVKNKVTGEPRKIRMFVISDEAHVRNALARLGQVAVQETLKKLGVSVEEVKKKILKKAKELNMTELLKKYETAEVVIEPAQVVPPAPEGQQTEKAQVDPTAVPEKKLVKSTSEYNETVVNTYTDEVGSGVMERKAHTKTTKEYSDGTNEVVENNDSSATKYTLAELEEKIQASIDELVAAFPPEVGDCVKSKVKSGTKPSDAVKECWKEYKDKQSAAMAEEIGKKETEITSLKAEVEKEKGEKISKDNEITNLKAELGTKTQELDTIKAKDNRTDNLTVGVVDVKGNSQDAQAIDEKAYGKKR
jgi:hypothetical protein